MFKSAWERELELAVARGLIPEDRASQIRKKASARARSPLDLLLDEGYLSAKTVRDLRLQLASSKVKNRVMDPHENTMSPAGKQAERTAGTTLSPAEADQDLPFLPGEYWGRFLLVSLLGQGGTGRVYKAYDPKLKRHVALKMLSVQDPRMARRFVNEARSQARVEHDRVCKVYEVGEAEKGPFITMQLIEGAPLHKMAPRMSLEKKLLTMLQVAQGVHEAHRAGLIHRDLKPGNIMVEQTEDGNFKPFVLDFGLARGLAETGMTLDSVVMGTPHYMSPEQARGENKRLDRRSDVYGLGATLHHILTDEPPFAHASPAAVFHQILEKDVPPLRKNHPEIPPEVERIVLKCMEKERTKRYDSARALAEDLGRYLDGEPILANPPSTLYRFGKKIRRNRLAFSIGAVGLIFILILSAWGLYTSWNAKIREKLIGDFTARVKEMETMARLSSTVPAHDIRPDRARIQETMDRIRRQAKQFGALGSGPGAYALGRGYLALGDFTNARRHLEAAWEKGYQEPEAAFSLSRVYGELFQKALWENQPIRDSLQREAQQREMERLYRDRALFFMKRGEGMSPGQSGYLEALIAFCEGRFEEALELLEGAPDRSPWFYEPLELAGDIFRARAGENLHKGKYAEADDDFKNALQAYGQASRYAESDPAMFRAIAEVHLGRLVKNFFGADTIEPIFREGLDAIDIALSLNPDDVETMVVQSRFYYTMAEFRLRHSEDPTDFLARASDVANRAEQIGGHSSTPQKASAIAFWNLARWALERGDNPIPMIEKALNAFARVDPADRDAEYYNKLGSTHMLMARYRARSGQPAERAWSRAESAYQEAVALFPERAAALINLGIYRHDRASFLTGEKRIHLFQEGLRALDRAREIDPYHVVTYYYLGRIHGALALRHEGIARRLYFEAAVSSYREGLSINPGMVHLLSGLGETLYYQALDLWEHAGAPGPLFDKAIAAYSAALQVDPDYFHTYINLSWAYLDQGEYLLQRGIDPRPCFQQAAHASKEALACGAGNIPLLSFGGAMLGLSGHAFRNGHDPDHYLNEAEESFQRFLTTNNRWDYPYRGMGRVHTLKARVHIKNGTTPRKVEEAFKLAGQFLRDAIERDDRDPDNYFAHARLSLFEAQWMTGRGLSAEENINQGFEALEKIRGEKFQSESEVIRLCLGILRNKDRAEERAKARSSLETLLSGAPFLQREWSPFLDVNR